MSAAASIIPKVSPAQMAKILKSAWTAPPDIRREYYTIICIYGDPGVGKTEMPQQVAAEVGIPFWKRMRPKQHEIVEITGMPKIREEDWRYVPNLTDLFPPPEFDGVVYLDEMTQLNTAEQQGWTAILDRAGVSGERISKDAMFLLAGNTTTCRAGASQLVSIIQNRCEQYEMVFSLADWQVWANNRLPRPVHPIVRSFADFKGTEFVPPFNPALPINATARSWVRAADKEYLHESQGEEFDTERQLIFSSLVGPGLAAEYVAYRRHWNLLHGVVDQIINTGKGTIPKELSVQHALIGALSERVRGLNGQLKDQNLKNLIMFGNHLTDSMSALLIINVLAASKTAERLLKLPEGESWIRKHKDALARRK